MACLTQLQIDNLFKHVGSYFKKLEDPNTYNHLEHFKYLYNLGINKGVKPETALSYVQVLPGLVNKYLTITNTKVSRDEALKLTSLSYDFEEFTLEKIGEYIGQVKQPDIVETQEQTPIEESFEANESLPLFVALTDQILSTTLMETKQFVTEAGQLEKDPIKEWHHNFVRALLDRGISSTSGAFDVSLNGHKGFRLKAVKMSSIPFDELFEELKQGKSEEEVKTTLDSLKAVALVITDNDGNILRFDENYTKSTSGKVVYFNLRPTDSEKINTENSRGRIQSIKDLAKNYKITEAEAKQLVDSEVNKLRNIQNSVFNGTDVLLDINGGTKGYIPSTLRPTTNNWYEFAKSNGISLGDIFDSFGMIPIDIVTEGKNSGKAFIYLNNGNLPILLLNRSITEGEALDYAKSVDNFLKDNNYSSGAVTTAVNFLSQYIAFNSNEISFLESYLQNTSNTVENIAATIIRKPNYTKNRFLSYQGNQDIYYGIKDGNIKQITADEYLNSWRDIYQTLLVKSANGKVEQFSSSLSFMPTKESEHIVNGTKEYKEVTTEKKNTSIVFGAGGNLTNLEDFLKEKNITSEASKKQIQDAYDWYNSSPIKKTIPFTVLFDIVNSNAKAVFGKEGIKLFFGSNYTDLYHEAWHGFSQLFLTKEQKVELYEEVKKISGSFVLPTGVRVNYKDASYKQIEELLAEDFRQYKLSNGKKVLGKRPVRNKIFRAILNFLDWLFDGVSFNQARTDFNSIKRVHDLYTKLDTGKIQEYKPSANNALFTSLASPIGITTESPLNETESVEVSESMDSIISDLMFQFAKQRGVSIFGDFLKSKEGIKNVYSKIRDEFNARLEQLEEDVEGNTEQIYILRSALNNYGDISSIIDSGNIEGDSTVQYHLRRSKILDWKSKEFDDENKEDSPDFRTLNEKANDGELSFEELANEKVLFLIRTLKAYEIKDGNYVPIKNSLGFSKLTNYRKTLGSIINTVSNNTGAFSIYNKLNEVKNKPEIQELLMKLGNISPNEDIADKNTFNSWVLFANTFNTTKLPMLITVVETFEDGEAQIYNIDASSDIITIKNKIINTFKTNTFNDTYATVNIKENEMMLDINKLKNRFQGNIRTDRDGFEFFQAIGIPLDNKLFNDYFQKDESLKRDIIKNANYVLEELSNLVDRNPTKYRDGLIQNHIDKLVNGTDTDKEFKTQSSVINKLLQLHIKVTDVISSFNLKNAEGNAEYENTLNSQISITQNNINESQTQQDLYNKPGFEHLNPANNPMIKASLTFGRLFKNGLRVANLNIRKFSGIQEKKDGSFIQGQSTLATDPVSKFYLEFYSYLTSGFTSNPTPSDKKTYIGFYVEDSTGDSRFIAPNMFSDGTTLGDIRLQEIMVGYLLAEHERVWDLNNTKDSDINRLGYFSDYGKEFMIFDNILTPETKEALKAISPTDILSEANSELIAAAKTEITEYINKLTDQNYEVFQKINFISDDVLKRATRSKGKINTIAQSRNLVKAFTANTFIQYIESTILFYGDISAYNLLKEDFHKRDSASGSTGRTMITDQQFIRAYNKFYGSEYAKSLGFSYAFDENGFANTAIFEDHKYENKALMKEYEDSWRKVYTEELKAQKIFSEKEIKNKVDDLIQKQLIPFTKKEVKEGDAQGWVTMDAYRFFSIMMNEWSPAHEDLYQKIVNGESVEQEKVLKVFSPKKFQYYGPISTSKYHINALHKFSLLPLIPNVIEGTNLDILHKRMMRDNIQYATFESGSKIASLRNSNNELDKFYSDSDLRIPSNDTLTPNKIHLRYLRNQVPINDYYKERVVFSTQLRALIYNDLFNKGIPLNKKISDLVNTYIDSIDKYVEEAKNELKQEIDFNNSNGTYNAQKLAKIIKKELDRRDIPQHLQVAATSISDDSFTYDMSLARNADDIEKILFSIANKRIVRRKFNGEALIQAASSGFENQRAINPTKEQIEEYGADNLLFYRTDPETGENLPMQVKIALQGKFKNLLGLEHPDRQKINTRERLNQAIKNKEWRDKHKEMLQLVGVRIPVQGHNAMEYMEVAEFLPEIAGPIVILPSYIVAKAGSDYDIDKLSIFFPNISGKTIYNLNNKNIKSITENSALDEAFSKSKLSKKDTVRFIADVLTNKQKNYKLTAEDKLIAEEIVKFKEIIDVKLSEDKLEKLENDILRNMIKILSTTEVFEMMKKPNGTYLVQDFADNVMTKYFETEYNPKKSFDNWNRSTVSKINSKFKVSPTNIFELLYNIYKQNANSGAKSALGIGANINKIKALFNQIDFQMEKEYDHTRWDKKKRKTQTQTRAIRLLLNHNQTKDGNISLGSLYNVEGIKISDYLNQLMNGWLDVAKDPWIFYVMGTPELTPSLLYLVSAGTPFEEAVYFLAQPAIRNYIEDVKKIESPISRLDKSFNYEYEFQVKAAKLGLQQGGNGHDLWNRQMGLINMEMQRTNGQLFSKEFLVNNLDSTVDGTFEFGTKDQAILAHFFEINDAAKAIARVQQSFNFDTKTSSTLFDSFKRAQKRDVLLEDVDFDVNFAKMFPKDKLTSLYEDTILATFDITDLQKSLFGKLFQIRNNELLNSYLYNIYSNEVFFGSEFDKRIKQQLGSPEKFISEFKNDFTTAMMLKMLYDFKIEDNKYKGLEIVKVNRDVDIKKLAIEEEPIVPIIPNYQLNTELKNEDGSKRFAQTTKENVIILNPVTNIDELFDYIEGKEGGVTSQQKKLVLDELSKQGYPLSRIKDIITTSDIANNFLLFHEQDHIDNNDRDVYWTQGKDLNTPDKIAIETRATIVALKKIEKQTIPTVSTEFQGYKGGFEDKGKGTPEGDGKDKAMRQVATSSIVEFKSDKVPSSSVTTLETIGTDNSYSYENDRYVGQSYSGVLPAFSGIGVMNNYGKTVMLARNGKLANKELSPETKNEIKKAHQQGAEFVVGDMPGVDSQFIDYLQEIGAKFTIYHTGNTPRIQITPTTPTISKEVKKGTKQPKFVATGVFIKDEKIYVDINRLNNIYVSLEDNVDTSKNIGGVSIKYPPKKAFRSFTEFVNYSLEKENLRYVLGKQEAKEIAIRMAANVGNRKRKFDDKNFTLKREFNASDEKNISQLLQTGGLEVTNQYGLLDLIDTSTGEVVLSNYKRGRGNYIKEYTIEPFNIISDAVETYLMDRALKNINNLYSYTQHSNLDYPTQLLDIINQYPELTTDYLLPSLLSPRKIKNSRNIQLVINQTDLDPTMISLLHEQYKELADENKLKVADKEANKYISKLFQQLSTYSLLTEGFSKQKTSNLSEVIGQEDLLQIGSFNNINKYVSDKLSKELDFNGKPKSINFLDTFSKKFFRNRLGLYLDNNGDWQYSRSGITNTKEYLIEDYVAKPTTPENIDNIKYLKKFSDNYYIINVNGIVADAPSSPDKSFKSKTLLEYADMFSDVTFIFDKATMKTLGLTNLKADNIKVVSSPEALASLNIEGPIALPSSGLDQTFNEVISEKFGILNLKKGIMDNSSLTDIINSDSLLVTTDIVNLIRAKAQGVLDELNNACNI